jgi:hypothetical protein
MFVENARLTPPIRLVPLRPCPLIPIPRVPATVIAFIAEAQEIPERRCKHGGDLAGVQPRDQRDFRVGVLARLLVVGVQQGHAGAHDELCPRETRRQLAEVLDVEGRGQLVVDVGEADFLVGLAAGCLEGGFF